MSKNTRPNVTPNRRGSHRVGCLTRTLLGLGVAVLVATGVGMALMTWDLRQHPPPGQLVDVGGYRLHIYCMGQGSPTVILDSGAGGTSLDWGWIQPELAKTTRVCAYDRAGAAWSDSGPLPRDAGQMTSELRALLVNAPIEGPKILVGASFAGHIARLYAAQYPDEVKGLVFVDPRPEEWDTRFPEIRQAGESQIGTIRFIATLSRLGILRLLLPLTGPPPFINKFPPETQATMLAVGLQARSYDAILDLANGVTNSDTQVRAAPLPQPMPIVVLTHGKADTDLYAGLPAQRWTEAEAIWQRLQADLATRLGGALIVADKSGHAIALEQPEAVIQAVGQVIQQTR